MDIRVTGTEEETTAVVEILRERLAVREVRGPYSNRPRGGRGSRLVRVYIELDPPTAQH